MTLQNSNLKLRPSVLVSDTVPAQNGGRMAYSEVVSGVKNNLLPDATAAQRLNGLVRWRKVFWHVDSADTVALNNVMIYMDKMTQGDDYLLIHGNNVTATGTQATDSGQFNMVGIGALASNVSAGEWAITVACEHVDYATLEPFRVGMTIRISNIPIGGGTGTEEFVVLTGVAFAGAVATLSWAAVSPLTHAYLAAETVVSGVIQVSTIAGAADSISTNTANGSIVGFFTGNVSVPSRGSIEESWTITFTSSNTFTVAGATVGNLPGIGSISADFFAYNSDSTMLYFTLASGTFDGGFLTGETVTFNTTQASVPLFIRQCIPAGSGSLAGNVGAIAIRGESA